MYEKVIKQFNDAYFNESPRRKAYPIGHIFDENKSVKWNQEEVIRQNNEIKEHNIRIREQRLKALAEAHNNIIKYLQKEYSKIHPRRVENLYHKVFEDIFDKDYVIRYVIDEVGEILEIFSEDVE